jgi:hypothetical protein
MDTVYQEMIAERILARKMTERGVKASDAATSAAKHRSSETNTFEEACWNVEAVYAELEKDGMVNAPPTA